jgi:hypothetical protein
MHRQSQLLYTVYAGSNDLEAPGVPHVVLRKMVHENYHTNTEGAPVNDIAVFRVRFCTGCIIIIIIMIILSDNCCHFLSARFIVLTQTSQPTYQRCGEVEAVK